MGAYLLAAAAQQVAHYPIQPLCPVAKLLGWRYPRPALPLYAWPCIPHAAWHFSSEISWGNRVQHPLWVGNLNAVRTQPTPDVQVG